MKVEEVLHWLERAGEDRHVARGGELVGIGQAVRVHPARAGHAETPGVAVHLGGETLDRAAEGGVDAIGGAGRVVVAGRAGGLLMP